MFQPEVRREWRRNGHVHALFSFRHGASHDHVFNLRHLQAFYASHGLLDYSPAHFVGTCVSQSTFRRFPNSRSNGGYDNCISHLFTLFPDTFYFCTEASACRFAMARAPREPNRYLRTRTQGDKARSGNGLDVQNESARSNSTRVNVFDHFLFNSSSWSAVLRLKSTNGMLFAADINCLLDYGVNLAGFIHKVDSINLFKRFLARQFLFLLMQLHRE